VLFANKKKKDQTGQGKAVYQLWQSQLPSDSIIKFVLSVPAIPSQLFLNDNLFTQARRNNFLATAYTPNADFLF